MSLSLGLSLGLTRRGGGAGGGGGGDFSAVDLFAGAENGDWWTAVGAGTVDTAIASLTGEANAIVLAQATGANQPILRQDAGGDWYLEFDGVNDVLRVNDATLRITGDLTIILGFYLPATGGFEMLVTCQTNVATISPYEFRVASGTAGTPVPFDLIVADGVGTGTASSGSGARVTQATKAIATVRRNSGVDVDFFIEEEGNSASRLGVAMTKVPTSDASSEFRLGARADGSFNLAGRIYEVLVIDRQLTDPEVQDVEAFFAGRMGITI